MDNGKREKEVLRDEVWQHHHDGGNRSWRETKGEDGGSLRTNWKKKSPWKKY